MEIENIPTEKFNHVIKTLVSRGWEVLYVYDEFNAWVDYGEVHLSKGGILVKFVWDNWMEGEVTADREVEEVLSLL